jgi:hypothetical protein
MVSPPLPDPRGASRLDADEFEAGRSDGATRDGGEPIPDRTTSLQDGVHQPTAGPDGRRDVDAQRAARVAQVDADPLRTEPGTGDAAVSLIESSDAR